MKYFIRNIYSKDADIEEQEVARLAYSERLAEICDDLPVFGAESPYIVDAGRQSDRAKRGRLPTSPLG
jgi:hypothetical protein